MSVFRERWILAAAKAGCWKWGRNTVVGSHTCLNAEAKLTKRFWKFGALSFSADCLQSLQSPSHRFHIFIPSPFHYVFSLGDLKF